MPILINAAIWIILVRLIAARGRGVVRSPRGWAAILIAVALVPLGLWQAVIYVRGKGHWLSGLPGGTSLLARGTSALGVTLVFILACCFCERLLRVDARARAWDAADEEELQSK